MTSAQRDPTAYPVEDYVLMGERKPALAYFHRLDEFRSRARPFLRAEEAQGYWVFTDHEAILDGLQHPELFSSRVIVPTEPDPPYKWIPIMLDPPEHTKWRRLLGSYFSPGRVERLEQDQRRFARDLIATFRDRGNCDFYKEFAEIFPTTIFLQILGLPINKLDEFMVWEDKILHGTPESDPDRAVALGAMLEVMGYFQSVITEKREHPQTRADDIVSNALQWEIEGEPITDQDLLSCLLLLFMAGLDTVASQLSYCFYHLATHPDDRRRLVESPSIVPHAVEEMLRAFPIVQTARVATQDVEFHGCPVTAGDMVAFPLGMAGRDDTAYPDATTVDFDRETTRHISFGAGPHRCLGSHLARQELTVALQEWHALIPDYAVADPDAVVEHAGGVYSLERLPLRWS
ncbi:MAG TPA: cytochrome P450 [Mycobacteriales bacterium]|nr:cytochrome P450 [Mycobacteriales bacterium]